MENNNFHQVVPDSQFFTNLDMIITFVQAYPFDRQMLHDLIIGLENTKKRGYMLIKQEDENVPSGQV
jgi:hypothetical protein